MSGGHRQAQPAGCPLDRGASHLVLSARLRQL